MRVKKHYHKNDGGDDGGDKGMLFLDSSDDLGVKSTGVDSTYNKGRDIEKVYIKNETNYFTFTIVNKYLFSTANKLKLFITLDLDTIVNSGRLTLPEDMRTKVSAKAAWEYCVYVSDNDYGIYKKDGTKLSMPFGMAVQKVTGDKGSVQVKILKSLINTPQAVRYTISAFAPSQSPNPDTLFQGGSSACDVYPGTNATFGGEINGYGEITSLGGKGVNDYTIYYVYVEDPVCGNGINPIVEYSPNGSILARYIYAGGLHIAKIAGADTHFYHCDALGSARVMTDENAVIKWQARYWPFGEMTKSGSADNTHGFTPLEISPLMYRGEDFVFVLRFLTGQAGKEWDSEMGLNYPVFSLILKDNKGNEDPALRDFCQRYYDPEIGRFTTLDTWTQLPDDERLFSYGKYLSWNNHEIKYTLKPNDQIIDDRSQYRDYNYAYDTLNNTFVSIYDISRMTANDSMRYNNRTYSLHSCSHQLNCYLYCDNNPLRYVDPEGRIIGEIVREMLWPSNIPCPWSLWDLIKYWPDWIDYYGEFLNWLLAADGYLPYDDAHHDWPPPVY